jgi:hypothetical protein
MKRIDSRDRVRSKDSITLVVPLLPPQEFLPPDLFRSRRQTGLISRK